MYTETVLGNIIAAWTMSRSGASRSYRDEPVSYIVLGIFTAIVAAVMLLRYVAFIDTLWYVSLGALFMSMVACGVFPARGGRWVDGSYKNDTRDMWVGASFGLSALLAVTTGLAYMFHA